MISYPLHLPEDVVDEARNAAAEDGVSVEQLFAALVSEGLGHRRGLADLRRRSGRADLVEALQILDRAPDVAPSEDDVLLEAPPPVSSTER